MTELEVALPCPVGRQAWLTALDGAHVDAALPTAVYATLVALSRRMATDGTVRCSLQELAGRSPRVSRTVQRHVAAAMADGWLTRVAGGRGGPGGTPSTYQGSRPVPSSEATSMSSHWAGTAESQDPSEATSVSSHSTDLQPVQTPNETTSVSSHSPIVRRHSPPSHSAHNETTLVVVVKREDPSGSEVLAVDRAAADDSTTAQPRPTATSKSGSEREGQPGPRSTPDPLAADVALAVEEPLARRSTPDPLEVSRAEEADDDKGLAAIRAAVACDPTTPPAVRRYGDGFRKAQAAVVHLPRGARRPARLQATGTCTVCNLPMIPVGDDKTTHPCCDPLVADGALVVQRHASQA